jgi:hypothetical protein
MAKGIPLMGRGPDGKAKMINVDENGNVKVQQSGNMMSIYKKTIAERPPANTVPVGTTFTLTNSNLDTWISDGIDWVEV